MSTSSATGSLLFVASIVLGSSKWLFRQRETEKQKILPFPKEGIRVSYLREFVENVCGGMEGVRGLVTTEVCEAFVKKATEADQSSLCDLLAAKNHPAVGPATVFISHAWSYQFIDVMDALEYHFRNAPDTIIWFDLFSNNQHKATELKFEWWCGTFKSAIHQFGHTVMVLAPWKNPIPLTRGWCLFELFCTADTKSTFEIAMSKAQQQEFLYDMERHGTDAIDQMLAIVDSENSKCWKPSDLASIKAVVEQSVGYRGVNSMVFEQMRDWVVRVVQEALKTSTPAAPEKEDGSSSFNSNSNSNSSNEANSTTSSSSISSNDRAIRQLTLQSTLASLYEQQGRYAEAEPLAQSVVEQHKKTSGEEDPKTLKAVMQLAGVYTSQGRYEEATALVNSCMETQKSILGEDHPETLASMNNLAFVYGLHGKYAEAEPLFVHVYEKRMATLGNSHMATLTAMGNLAALYMHQGHFVKAEPLVSTEAETHRKISGENHPKTLMAVSNLAFLYEKQGRYAEAEPLCVSCFERRKAALGEEHPETLQSMNNLAKLYQSRGKYKEAEAMFASCFEKYHNTAGENHPATLHVMNNLASLYFHQGKYKEAEPIFVLCLEKRQSVLGNDHPNTLITRNSLAKLRQEESGGRMEASLSLKQQQTA